MQQNQTKIFADIGELNTLQNGDGFNADNVWNKLEQKLTKKKSKKVYWIWLAASMLILISIPAFFKTNKSTKSIIATKIVIPKKIEIYNTKKPVIIFKNISKKDAVKTINQQILKQQVLEPDTLQNIVESIQPIKADTIEIVKNAIVSSPPLGARGKKKLKVVYASDLYEENNQQVPQQELAKEQPKKSFFKLFEKQNKEPEESTTTENQQQPNKTFLGFKSKPTATISINENQ